MGKMTRNFFIVGMSLAAVYGMMKAVARKRAESADIDDDNLYLKDGSSDTEKNISTDRAVGTYEGRIKPVLDQILSFAGLVILSPLFGLISVAVYLDDPGPILFTQKRVGKDKRFFCCHKFRSMRMDTPHDVPTHRLENPDTYITRVGRVLRCTSLDELPQMWDIFCSKMSIIGPRPALWNQDDLVAEREKYGANNIMPGLTGLAQISGRDELEIADKARIDGEYAAALTSGGLKAAGMDLKCFFGTIKSVLKHDGVIEGGTGSYAFQSRK